MAPADSPRFEASGALVDWLLFGRYGTRQAGRPVPRVFEGAFVGTRIYVGNLPYSADNAQLSQMFSAYGDVVDVRVITDRDSGQSKGFAFVEMSTEESARQAIAGLNGTMLDNRALRLDEASERPAGGRSGQSNGGGYGDRSRRDDRSRNSGW